MWTLKNVYIYRFLSCTIDVADKKTSNGFDPPQYRKIKILHILLENHKIEKIISKLIEGVCQIFSSKIPLESHCAYEITVNYRVDDLFAELVGRWFDLLIEIFTYDNKNLDYLETFFNQIEDKQINIKEAFVCKNAKTRKMFHDKIKLFVKKIKPKNGKLPKDSFLDLSSQIAEHNVRDNITLELAEYYSLVAELYTKESTSNINISKLVENIFLAIKCVDITKKSPTEKYEKIMETLIANAIKLTKHLESKEMDTKAWIDILCDECLFGNPTKSNDNESFLLVKCKDGTLRKNAFILLWDILEKCENDGIILLFQKIRDHLDITPNLDDSWFTTSEIHQRNDFVGLKNLGCTCYLNVIIQQLSMIPSFSAQFLSLTDPTPSEDRDKSVMFQLQRILLVLLESKKRYHDPSDFCYTVKAPNGEIINPNEQTDFQEILGALLSQLDEKLKNTNDIGKKLLNQTFGGKTRFITTGQEEYCTHINERDEDFQHLTLTVQNASNLEGALKKFTEGEVLEGENAYYCEKCDRKVKVIRRQTIQELPNNLILCLNRFEWNFESNTRVKLNNYFEFPLEFNIKSYMSFSFDDSASNSRNKFNENKEDNDIDSNNKYELNESDYIYELVGVVIHSGTAERGHYYAYIKDRKNEGDNWYEFNDVVVKLFDISKLMEEAFGGKSQGPTLQNTVWKNSKADIIKDRNAYVLFYQKKNAQSQKSDSQLWRTVDYLAQEHEEIKRENLKIFRQQTIFDESFVADFMPKLFNQKGLPAVIKEDNRLYVETSLRFVFNVISSMSELKQQQREKWWNKLTEIITQTEESIEHFFVDDHEQLVSWMINTFFTCPLEDIRKNVLSFFNKIIEKIKEYDEKEKNELLRSFYEALSKVIENIHLSNVNSKSKGKEFFGFIKTLINTNDIEPIKKLILRPLIHLVERDRRYIHWSSDGNNNQLLQSKSYLDITLLYDIIYILLSSLPRNQHEEYIQEIKNDINFIKSIVAKQYDINQVEIIKYICENDIEMSKIVIECIHERLESLDFYEVFGALQCFNGLLSIQDDYRKLRIEEALTNHLKILEKNQQYWRLTEISLLLLFEAAKTNDIKAKIMDINNSEGYVWITNWVKSYSNKKNIDEKTIRYYRSGIPQMGNDKEAIKKWKNDVEKSIKIKGQQDLLKVYNQCFYLS